MRQRNVFLYFGAPLMLEWVLSLGIQLLFMFFGVDIQKYATEVTTFAAVVMIPVFWYFYRRDQKEMDFWTTERKAGGKEYIEILLLAVCCCIGVNNLVLLSGVTRQSATYQATAELIYESPIWVQILGLAILVPVMEELVYRGLLYKRMRSYLPAGISIIGSSLLFGVYHGNMAQLIFAGVIGLVMAYLMEEFRTLKVTILFHVVVNLTSIFCTWTGLLNLIFRNIYSVTIVTMLASVGAFLCIYFIKNKSK